MDTMDEAHQLDQTEQQAWSAYLEVMRRLPNHLSERLYERHNLTLTDYQVLVEVSESENHRVRMTELAHRTQLSRSRLSYQTGRIEQAGLVTRTTAAEDRRGQSVELTEDGWKVLRTAAPRHVEDVRELFFDPLEERQIEVLAVGLRAIADRLEKPDVVRQSETSTKAGSARRRKRLAQVGGTQPDTR